MKDFLVILLIVFIVVPFVLGSGLKFGLPVFWKYLIEYSKLTFRKDKGLPRMGEVVLTLVACLVISVLALLVSRFLTAFVAWLFASDIIEFFTLSRSVFAFNRVEIQSPLTNLVPGLLISPLVQLATVFLIFKSIRSLFTYVNRRSRNNPYSEADALYWGIITVFSLMILETFMFAQSTGFRHWVLVVLYTLPYLFWYLSLTHINLVRDNTYREELDDVIIMSPEERTVTFSIWKPLVFTYAISVILLIGFHFGLQWLSGFIYWLLFVAVGIGCYFLLKKLSREVWDPVAPILFDQSLDLPVTDNLSYQIGKKKQNILIGLFLTLCVVFSLSRPELFVMVAIISSIPMVLSGVAIVIAYFLSVVFSKYQLLKRDNSKLIFRVKQYFPIVFIALGRAVLPSSAVIFAVFMILSVFPKELPYERTGMTGFVLDKKGEVLLISRSLGDGVPVAIPVQYKDITNFMKRMIIYQEDRGFYKQNRILGSTSNWNGISPAFFLRFRGGSNLINQLVKNLNFPNGSAPRDVARKFSEQLAAFQLSINYDSRDLMTWYVNSIFFHGGMGNKGLQSASLHAFGRPVHELNHLEQMYLASTLQNPRFLREIGYRRVQYHVDEIKRVLIARATRWQREGLLSVVELNILKNETLRFTNRPYRPNTKPGSRLFIQRQLNLMPNPNAKYVSSITRHNQEALETAVAQYLRNRRFPVPQHADYELITVILAANYRTGEILAHFSNAPRGNCMTRWNFSIASINKSFILLQMLEDNHPIILWDGPISGRNNPRNASGRHSNRFVGASIILSQSLNLPIANIRDAINGLANTTTLFRNLEGRFAKMGISACKESVSDVLNYGLGANRYMNLFEILQKHQVLFNDGVFRPLTVMNGIFNPATNRIEPIERSTPKQIFQKQNTDIIKHALSYTIRPSGTASSIRSMLPTNRRFYAKSGTAQEANHGLFILADDEIMILVYLSFGRYEDGHLDLNRTPPIPMHSASNSAGLIAAYAYRQLTNTKKQ
ncbi:MAG: transglycosylase domain-containing protein [Lentimicrobiaceae bacterium]|nr:transglycosylase domain-containing protein [Lentimicrobiaceae bacterium]